MLVSSVSHRRRLALSLARRVSHSYKLMQSYGSEICQKFVDFFVCCHLLLKLFQVQLVIILSIDLPTATHPDHPRIIIELWRGSPEASQRDARRFGKRTGLRLRPRCISPFLTSLEARYLQLMASIPGHCGLA